MKELAENDISNVQLLQTEYSKIEELKIELKGKAVAKAKTQAEEMVKALGQKVGTPLFISDIEVNLSNYFGGQISGLNIRGANSVGYKEESNLDISFDNIRVDATVTVYFKID